jgi:pyrroline-5-carboxylate reductase
MANSPSGPVVLVGAGNMGGAMLRGWVASGFAPSRLLVIDPRLSDAMAEFVDKSGVGRETDVPDGLVAGTIVLAVKPQAMSDVLPPLARMKGPDTVVVSVAAGTTIARIEALLGSGAVVRAMPNTPAMVGRGITAAVPNGAVTGAQRDTVDELLRVCGPVEWLEDERLIDAVTAVSGSGPAYAFYLAECMAEAGRKAGLAPDLAMRLARATVAGAGEMMHRSADDAATLRRNVTSPNGTTAAALDVLMADDGLQPIFDAAVAAAKKRAQELAAD